MLFGLLSKEVRLKQGECGALMVKGHISNPRYGLRPLPAAPLVVRRRYLPVVQRPFPAAPLAMRRRYLVVVSRLLLVVRRRFFIEVPRPMPEAPRRYLIVAPRPLPAAPLVLRASAAACGAARCASQVLNFVARPLSAALRQYYSRNGTTR